MFAKWLFIFIMAAAPLNSLPGNCQHLPNYPLTEEDIYDKYTKDAQIFNPFRLHKLGLGRFADIAEYSTLGSDLRNTIRNNDPDNPGNYFEFPGKYIPYIEVDLKDKAFLGKLLSKYLDKEFYSEAILDSIHNICIDNLERKEFFFEITINNTRLRFSGWYGKFVHIFVFTEFDSKESFIEKAEQFFNLPSLKIDNVSYDEETVHVNCHDFFYSYDDKNTGFKLFGYPNLKIRVMNDSVDCFNKGTILDLTVYPEEE